MHSPESSRHTFARYANGSLLYGDDFTFQEIQAWFADEAEGYADLGARDASAYSYGYHALNHEHGFKYLKGRQFSHLLGFGSAYGDELQPVLSGAQSVCVIDPSSAFVQPSIGGVSARYVKPDPSGLLPLDTASFDFCSCLGVLHHIPNVSFVLRELHRVMQPGAAVLLREPIHSMGDWSRPRAGLTKRERGIPLALLRKAIKNAGFNIQHEKACVFSLTPRLFGSTTRSAFSNPVAVKIDALLAKGFAWNKTYHAQSLWQRFRPTSAFFVLQA
jgi:SAM-dependent methyltransferase